MPFVLLIDDHPLYHEGLASALHRLMPDLRILGAPAVSQSLQLLRTHPEIELALIDIGLPGVDGWAAMGLYAAEFPHVARVLISGREDEALVRRARDAGALGFLPKSLGLDEMAAALRGILDGGVYFPVAGESLSRRREQALSPDSDAAAGGPDSLTLRQLEVLQLLGQGCSNKQIARHLQIADRTVRAHITDIFRLLGVSSRTQAVLAAMRLGLLQEPDTANG